MELTRGLQGPATCGSASAGWAAGRAHRPSDVPTGSFLTGFMGSQALKKTILLFMPEIIHPPPGLQVLWDKPQLLVLAFAKP